MNLQEDAKLLFVSVILAYQNSMIYFAQNRCVFLRIDREQGIFEMSLLLAFAVI